MDSYITFVFASNLQNMKKRKFLFLFIFAVAKLQAQDYLISFEGTGATTAVDSVKVENLTQGTSLTVHGGNQLHLLGTVSVANPASADLQSVRQNKSNICIFELARTYNKDKSFLLLGFHIRTEKKHQAAW